MNKDLVKVVTSDGLHLHGFFVHSQNSKKALLHIHGFEGNFYENWFVHVLAKSMEEKEMSFLTINTRGNGRDTSFNTNSGEEVVVGARYELLEDAYKDIDAWIEFLVDKGCTDIILSGHSLGTYKVVRYLFEGGHKEKISKLILLSPFDKRSLLENYTKKTLEETLEIAEQKVQEGQGKELISLDLDAIVLSYATYCSWYKQDDFGKVFEFSKRDYSSPILQKISIPTKIIVGSKDEYFHTSNPENPEEAMSILLRQLPHSKGKIIDDAVHSFAPHETILAEEINTFI